MSDVLANSSGADPRLNRQQIHVIVSESSDPHGLLQRALNDLHGSIKVQVVAEVRLRRTWNRLLRGQDLLVCSHYHIDDEFDVATVLRFIEALRENRSRLFYAPRPNSFVQVNKAAIFGSPPTPDSRFNSSQSLFRLAEHIYHRSPKQMRRVLIRVNSWRTRMRHQDTSVPDRQTERSEPTSSAPRSLPGSADGWIEWSDSAALHRDLLDRNHLYFPHPTSMHVAVLNRCNLKCVMCPYHSPVYREVHTSGYFDEEHGLTMDTFRRLASYAGKRGIALQFGQIEEALLHEHIFDFIRLAKSLGVPHVHLTTNGTLLTRRRALLLAESGVDSVMFSIDSVDDATYRKIRGASLGRLERNIEHFLPLARKHGIRVVCSFIRQEPALSQRDEFLERWRDRGVDAVTFYVLSDHDPRTGEFIRTEQFREDPDRYPCASPWVQTAIMPDGSVGLCCKTMTDVGWKITSVGNINEQDFDEIWTSENYRAVRMELLNNSFSESSTCKQCPIWSANTNVIEDHGDYIRTFNETSETIEFLR